MSAVSEEGQAVNRSVATSVCAIVNPLFGQSFWSYQSLIWEKPRRVAPWKHKKVEKIKLLDLASGALSDS